MSDFLAQVATRIGALVDGFPWLVVLVIYIGEKLQQRTLTKVLSDALTRAQEAAHGVLPPAANPVAQPTAPSPQAAPAPPAAPSKTTPATPAAPTETPVVDPGLVDFVKKQEGFSAKAYYDYKQYSIGYGTKANSSTEVIDEAEATRRLTVEIDAADKLVEAFIPNAPKGVKQGMTDATYNLGSGWQQQELGQLLKAGNYEEAKSHLLQYNHAGGQVLEALTKRRQAEVNMFDTPL